jgi:hypothetical protein
MRRSWMHWVMGTALFGLLSLLAWWRVPAGSTEHAPSGGGISGMPESRGAASGMTSGIRPLSSDPATPPLEWARDEVDVELPEQAPRLHELLTKDEESLEDLMDLLEWSLPLGQGGEAGLEMARCAARFEPELESRCSWVIDAVMHRRTKDTGEIVYAKAVLTDGADQPACRAMASCSSEAWARREQVPMPPQLGDELAFSEIGRSSLWDQSKGVDPVTHYRRITERERSYLDGLEAAARGPTMVTPSSLGWNMLFSRHHLDEFECMVELLEGREGKEACGA